MSSHPPPASQQGSRRSGARGGEDVRATRGSGRGGGGRATFYLHAVTDEQAAVLTDDSKECLLQEIKMKTGADVKFDSNPSPVPGMKILVIRGVPGQIEASVKFISEKTGIQETISDQAQTFWLKWVEASFPDLDSRAYFLPPVYVNRVPMNRQLISGQDVLVLHPSSTQHVKLNQAKMIASTAARDSILQPSVQDSDIKDDKAMQRLLVCLQTMSEQNKEVLVGISQLRFGQYLGEPCYAAAAAHLPSTKTFPSGLSRDRQGDFDLLFIHRHYGLVVCEVKAFGENWNKCDMSQQDIYTNVRIKLKQAIQSLNKAEAMLSHLVSDIAPGLRITKTIAFPNLTASQVQWAVCDDSDLSQLKYSAYATRWQDLCRCLGTSDPADIPGLCLCSDQLSDLKTPCDVSSHVLRELGHWWQRRVAGAGRDSHMTPGVYKTLVARFCGPATTVSVPCTCLPRVRVKTLGQAVWWTGECYTAVITLFPEQVHLLHSASPRVYVTGPPGTGKTVVLLLMAIQWLRCGHDVHILSTWWRSRAVCIMLHHLLLQAVKVKTTQEVSVGSVHLHEHDILLEKNMKNAVTDLSQRAREGSLYVIADEVGPESWPEDFKTFCEELLKRVPNLHLWAGSCYDKQAPAGFQVEYLTRPLRSPPVVVREVENTWDGIVHPYCERGVLDHTDGPPVKRFYHGGEGHSGEHPGDCIECGRKVANFLHELRVGVPGSPTMIAPSTSKVTTPPALQWRDVLVMYYWMDYTGVMEGFKEAGIPVQLMVDDNIEDVATARSDVVWVARVGRVRGLERKVIVSLDPDINTVRLHLVSRCTSQLVTVSKDKEKSSQP